MRVIFTQVGENFNKITERAKGYFWISHYVMLVTTASYGPKHQPVDL